MYEKEKKTMNRMSQTGLWGSVIAVILTGLFLYASPWRFSPQTDYVSRWMLMTGSILAVLALCMALLVIRKRVPQLRQSDTLEAKLVGYSSHVRSLYLGIFAVVIILCVMMLLSGQTVLLMLAIVTVMLLFLAYPNMYKVKVDLGLSDEEMQQLYGDRYIVENKNEE
ncbi:MAG: hypothetical protein ACSW8I_01960 [bacterium]